ncbi:MAG: TetR/AcrR family transcriptional regulator [Terracidiphilus sp.]
MKVATNRRRGIVAQLRAVGRVAKLMPFTDVGARASAEKIISPSSRERILQAAKHLFARNGYENTSTVAIAREAGTSESQLMKHFGSKQGLLSDILDRGWASVIQRVQALRTDAPSTHRLLNMLEAIVIEMENDQELKELMTLEARRVRRDSRDVLMSRGYRQFTELFDGLLSEMRREEQIRPDVNLEAVRAAFIGMVESLLRDQVVARRSDLRAGYSFDDVRRLLHVLVPALGGKAAAPLKCANG